MTKVENPKLIMEIGIDALPDSKGMTSTKTLCKLKPDECIYLGIDIAPKSYLDNLQKQIFTICTDSAVYENIYDFMNLHNQQNIDFLFIDGWHSVNQVLKEWNYWSRMSPNGVMAFHDTNIHPGPVTLLDAIDTNIFSVEYFGRNNADWGVGVVQRIKY